MEDRVNAFWNNKQEFIIEIINRIEARFDNSVVVWRGTGNPDEEFDSTENFDALWITDDRYEEFENFVDDLEENYANPNGFSIMVHGLSPKVTREYCWDIYQSEKQKRVSSST